MIVGHEVKRASIHFPFIIIHFISYPPSEMVNHFLFITCVDSRVLRLALALFCPCSKNAYCTPFIYLHQTDSKFSSNRKIESRISNRLKFFFFFCIQKLRFVKIKECAAASPLLQLPLAFIMQQSPYVRHLATAHRRRITRLWRFPRVTCRVVRAAAAATITSAGNEAVA